MKKRLIVAACIAITLTASSCEDKHIIEPNDVVAKERVDIVLNKSQKAINEAANEFATKLFDLLCRKDEDNLFMSPYSAQIALAIATNGADGVTREEMLETLGFKDLSVEEMNGYNKTMIKALTTLDNTTKVNIANGVWGNPDMKFSNEFKKVCANSYEAEVAIANFKTGEAQNIISDWTQQKTGGMIKDAGKKLLPETVSAIVNSLYFNGRWSHKFDKSFTSKKDFVCADGEKTKVDMMYLYETDLFWKSGDGYEMINLPYGNEAFSMTVLLPNEGEELSAILSETNLEIWSTDMMDMHNFNVQLPRFELSSDIDLLEAMKQMGIKKAFEKDADFTKMITNASTFISTIYQLAKIKVDEEGTEAAAVTIIGNECTSVGGPYKIETRNFFVNRPFAFAIKEKSTGAILFMGKVTDLK